MSKKTKGNDKGYFVKTKDIVEILDDRADGFERSEDPTVKEKAPEKTEHKSKLPPKPKLKKWTPKPTTKPKKETNSLTSLDQIAVVVDILLALMLMAAPFLFTPKLKEMFSDFGSVESFPYVTGLVMETWFPIICAIPVLAFVVIGLFWKGTIRWQRLMITTSFVIGFISGAFYLYGIHAPIFLLAGAVKG